MNVRSKDTKISPFKGFFYPYRGLKFLFSNPGLISIVAIPVGINALLYSLLIWYVQSKISLWIESLIPKSDAWYWAILYYFFIVLVGAILLVIVFYSFTLIGNFILTPFNEIISEKVEIIYSGGSIAGHGFSLSGFFSDMIRSYKAEGAKLLLYLAGFLLLLLFNLLPGIGTVIYGAAAMVYSLFFLCWEFLDYPMERWRFTFRLKWRLAFNNMFVFIFFGAGSAFLLIIPFINLAAIPVCVIGATLLFCDLKNSGRMPELKAGGEAVEGAK